MRRFPTRLPFAALLAFAAACASPTAPSDTGATPSSPPRLATAVDTNPSFEQQVLTLVNQQRTTGATCGATPHPPVAPLSLDPSLRIAARDHSADMALNDYISHVGSDSRLFSERIWDAGYTGNTPLGENIAAGQVSPQSAVDGWMASVDHCENIMNAGFQDLGVGYAFLTGSRFRHYWTQSFGGG